MEQVNFNGQMDQCITDNFIIIILKELENIYGQMGGHTQEIGKTIKCMEKVCLHGQMAGNMKVNMLKIRSKEMESFTGLMVESMLGSGIMVNNMEEVHLWQLMDRKEMENGHMERDRDGLMNEYIFLC